MIKFDSSHSDKFVTVIRIQGNETLGYIQYMFHKEYCFDGLSDRYYTINELSKIVSHMKKLNKERKNIEGEII